MVALSGAPSVVAISTKGRRPSMSPLAGSHAHAQTTRRAVLVWYIVRPSGLQQSAFGMTSPSAIRRHERSASSR